MSTPAQLRTAARIHYVLKGMLGEGIDVAAMLNDPAEAREILFVCQASGNPELVALANQFFIASEVARLADVASLSRPKATPSKAVRPAQPAPAPQDAAWSRDTSGFGLSLPGELPTQPNARTRWLKQFAQRLVR